MRKVGLYLRVSTQEQAERGWSIEGQYTELRKFCEGNADWKVVRVLKDPGYSAANLERPGVQQLLELAQAGNLDIVVVWRYDRLSRDNVDFPLLLSLLRKHGVDVVSATEPAEGTDDPTGEFVVHMIGLLATLERKQIALRVKMGMRTRTRNGLWHGGPVPYGYAYDRAVGKLVPEAIEAAVVKHIFELYLKAGRLHAVKEAMPRGEVSDRNGKPWTVPVLRNILRRRLYTGRLICGGVEVEDPSLALVEDGAFERCQVLLAKERERNEDEISSTEVVHVHLNKEDLPACPRCGSHQAVRRKRVRTLADGTPRRKYWCRACETEFDAVTASEPRPFCPTCGATAQPSRARTAPSGVRYRPLTCRACGTHFRTILDTDAGRRLPSLSETPKTSDGARPVVVNLYLPAKSASQIWNASRTLPPGPIMPGSSRTSAPFAFSRPPGPSGRSGRDGAGAPSSFTQTRIRFVEGRKVLTDAETLRLFLGDLVKLLLEYARTAKADSKASGRSPADKSFSEGEAFGRYMTLSTIIDEARAFGIPLGEIGLEGIDPVKEDTAP